MSPQDNQDFRRKKVSQHARNVYQLERPQYMLNDAVLKRNKIDIPFLQSFYESIPLAYPIEDRLTVAQSHKLIRNIFFAFYHASVFYKTTDRQQLFCNLLEWETHYENTDDYPLFLLIVAMYYISLEIHLSEAKRIIKFLTRIHVQEDEHFTFDDLIFIQYSALLDHYTLHNEDALEKLLIVQQYAQVQNMKAMNEYYLTMVYLSLGDSIKAKHSSQNAIHLFLATDNSIRWLYTEMNDAKIMASIGQFNRAITIYGNCLIGAINMKLDSMAEDILECKACSELYAGQYEQSLRSLDLLHHSKHANNLHYHYALNYFYLEQPHKALKWLEAGKQIEQKSQTSILYLELVELFLFSNNQTKIIRHLEKMYQLEYQSRHYGSRCYIAHLLIFFLTKQNRDEEAKIYQNVIHSTENRLI